MMSKVQHFSESEDGWAMQSNSFMDSMLDTSKLLCLVLTEWIYELTLKIYTNIASVDPSLPPCLPPCPLILHDFTKKHPPSVSDRLEFCFDWQSLGDYLVSKSSNSGRLTDMFLLFPPAAGGFYRVYQLWRDCSFLLCHSWWGLCCQTHCEYY